ncbi:hypothetical protein GGI12_005669 [Dipsacomyces acuminosporus]|nr:hypothetical protein GGI12_005669 [Dipsacomyces acuminosporus]
MPRYKTYANWDAFKTAVMAQFNSDHAIAYLRLLMVSNEYLANQPLDLAIVQCAEDTESLGEWKDDPIPAQKLAERVPSEVRARHKLHIVSYKKANDLLNKLDEILVAEADANNGQMPRWALPRTTRKADTKESKHEGGDAVIFATQNASHF